jgi:hypothetical protein
VSGGLHGRDVTNDAFYEWLLSDHPDARAERDRRRAATHQVETGRAAAVRAWADKINAQRDAPHPLQDLAASMGPLADQAAARAEARYAEPDEILVTRLRTQHETHIRVCGPPGSWDYRYPAHLTGPAAAAYPPPPEPDAVAPEPEAEAGDTERLPNPRPSRDRPDSQPHPGRQHERHHVRHRRPRDTGCGQAARCRARLAHGNGARSCPGDRSPIRTRIRSEAKEAISGQHEMEAGEYVSEHINRPSWSTATGSIP